MGKNNQLRKDSVSVATKSEYSEVEAIYKRILLMPIECRAVLIKRLMGDFSLQVSFGDIVLSASATSRINSLDKSAIVAVLQAISNRF